MTTPNLPLLRQVREQIEKHPETWDQSLWFSECGTAACVAGWAAALTGGRRADFGEKHLSSSLLVAVPDDHEYDVVVVKGQRLVFVDDRAQRLLGIDDKTGDELFNGNATMADVRRIMDEIEADAAADVLVSEVLAEARGEVSR